MTKPPVPVFLSYAHEDGVIQLWVKEYESDAKKGGGKTNTRVSTVPAPGLSAKLIPYLLEQLAFLTVLDVGAFMPPKVEIPEVVSMRDPLVEAKAKQADEILKIPQQRLLELEKEKRSLFTAVRDGLLDREALVEWSRKEEEARLALEDAYEENQRLKAWVSEHDLLGAYLQIVQSLAKQARMGSPVARMAQGTIPRWFAVLPCEKPFELWKTKRTTWGDELGKERLPAFFTGPQPSIWKWRPQRQQVYVIGSLKPSVTYPLLSQTLIEHWDGKTWSIVQSPNGDENLKAGLSSVTVISENDIWAVGQLENKRYEYRTLIEHWNGQQWHSVPSPNAGRAIDGNALSESAGLSTTMIWAVGTLTLNDNDVSPDSTPLIERWDGNVWKLVPGAKLITPLAP